MLLRPSHGLEAFVTVLEGMAPGRVVDLSGGNDANIHFLDSICFKTQSDPVLAALDHSFGVQRSMEEATREQVRAFFELTLDQPDASFDGALVWDVLQFLPTPLLPLAVEQLHRVVRPNGPILACFHGDEKSASVPTAAYCIQDRKHLQIIQRDTERPVQFLSNRALERLFASFQSIKFFLSRDYLREVLIRR